MFGNWIKLGWDWTMLALECQQVIALRMAKFWLGGTAASREANRMVSEKVIALVQVAAQGASGDSPHSVAKKYRKKVRSNRRRLAR
jgi:hypothetical protein